MKDNTPCKVIVCRPNQTDPLSPQQLADWANTVHLLAKGKGLPFTADMFPNERLRGHHCNCGVTEEGLTKGEFELLPLYSAEVKEGGKAYMQCGKCGGWSHL
jgi:hypothetical protein